MFMTILELNVSNRRRVLKYSKEKEERRKEKKKKKKAEAMLYPSITKHREMQLNMD